MPTLHPQRYSLLTARNLRRDVLVQPADLVQRDDRSTLDFCERVEAALRTIEERRRRRGSGGGQCCCSRRGKVAVLPIMTIAALATVLVAHQLPRPAARAEELHIRRVNRREQAEQHTQTAWNERWTRDTPSRDTLMLLYSSAYLARHRDLQRGRGEANHMSASTARKRARGRKVSSDTDAAHLCPSSLIHSPLAVHSSIAQLVGSERGREEARLVVGECTSICNSIGNSHTMEKVI